MAPAGRPPPPPSGWPGAGDHGVSRCLRTDSAPPVRASGSDPRAATGASPRCALQRAGRRRPGTRTRRPRWRPGNDRKGGIGAAGQAEGGREVGTPLADVTYCCVSGACARNSTQPLGRGGQASARLRSTAIPAARVPAIIAARLQFDAAGIGVLRTVRLACALCEPPHRVEIDTS